MKKIDASDVGRIFRGTNDRQGEDLFLLESWCDLPTFTLRNIKTREIHHYTTAQIISLLERLEPLYTEKELYDSEMKIKPEDLKIDTFRPPDGDANSHSTGIRFTHKLTGIKAESWRHRTIAMNRKTAYTELTRLLSEKEKK